MIATHESDEWTGIDATGRADRFINFLDSTRDEDEAASGGLEKLLAPLRLAPGHDVVEIGCGLGLHLQYFSRRVGPRGRVVGVDSSLELLVEARARLGDEHIELRQGDAHRLELEDDSFNCCWSTSVMMHLEDPTQALREMVRVTRPGGRIAIREAVWDSWVVSAADAPLTRRILACASGQIRNGTIAQDLPGLFVDAGLRDLEVRPASLVRYGNGRPRAWQQVVGVMERAVAIGEITRAEGDAWLEDVRARHFSGRYMELLTFVCVAATVP